MRKIPGDVANVLDTFDRLGRAARRALYVSEKWAAAEVREAARRAAALAQRAQR